MPAKKSIKTISKAYPPQITVSSQQLHVYCPLDHWVETHSSSSVKDLIGIEGSSQPLFMNNCNQEIVMQDENSLWLKEWQSEEFCSYQRQIVSQHSIISTTAVMNDCYVNLNEEAVLNSWKVDSNRIEGMMEDSNPEQKYVTEKLTSEGDQKVCTSISTSIEVESLIKKSRNGQSLANIIFEESSFLTLHSLTYGAQTSSRICQSELSDLTCSSFFYRCHLPSEITSFASQNNTILAYGGQNLLLIDKRCESVVSRLNDLPDSSVNQVKICQKPCQMMVCRDSSILLQDIRKPTEIISVLLTNEGDIDSFQILEEKEESFYVVANKKDGKVKMYPKGMVD